MGNIKEEIENYAILSAIMICLETHDEEADAGILILLEVLLSPEREEEEKKRILDFEFLIEMNTALESEVVSPGH